MADNDIIIDIMRFPRIASRWADDVKPPSAYNWHRPGPEERDILDFCAEHYGAWGKMHYRTYADSAVGRFEERHDNNYTDHTLYQEYGHRQTTYDTSKACLLIAAVHAVHDGQDIHEIRQVHYGYADHLGIPIYQLNPQTARPVHPRRPTHAMLVYYHYHDLLDEMDGGEQPYLDSDHHGMFVSEMLWRAVMEFLPAELGGKPFTDDLVERICRLVEEEEVLDRTIFDLGYAYMNEDLIVPLLVAAGCRRLVGADGARQSALWIPPAYTPEEYAADMITWIDMTEIGDMAAEESGDPGAPVTWIDLSWLPFPFTGDEWRAYLALFSEGPPNRLPLEAACLDDLILHCNTWNYARLADLGQTLPPEGAAVLAAITAHMENQKGVSR